MDMTPEQLKKYVEERITLHPKVDWRKQENIAK